MTLMSFSGRLVTHMWRFGRPQSFNIFDDRGLIKHIISKPGRLELEIDEPKNTLAGVG